MREYPLATGAAPGPCWGSLQRSPSLLAGGAAPFQRTPPSLSTLIIVNPNSLRLYHTTLGPAAGPTCSKILAPPPFIGTVSYSVIVWILNVFARLFLDTCLRPWKSLTVRSVLTVIIFITPPPVGIGSGVLFSLDFFLSFFLSLYVCIFVSLFLCQQDYEKTAGPICMKFSRKVWSDHGTTWFNFGSIRVNGSPQNPQNPQIAQNGDLDN